MWNVPWKCVCKSFQPSDHFGFSTVNMQISFFQQFTGFFFIHKMKILILNSCFLLLLEIIVKIFKFLNMCMVTQKNKQSNSTASEVKVKEPRIVNIKLFCIRCISRYKWNVSLLARCSNFEGRVELVRPGVDVFFRSADWGYSGDVNWGLEWLSEAWCSLWISLLIQRMQVEFLCEHGYGVWRRLGLEWICMLGQLIKVMMVMLKTCWPCSFPVVYEWLS